MGGHVIDRARLPASYPTHAHDPEFWLALGRAVGTFGFLEETLLKAIFALTATTPIGEKDAAAEYASWVAKITRSLSDTLSGLIDSYAKAVRLHPQAKIQDFDQLVGDLREACKLRNAICHGSWRSPDASGFSVPLYVNKQGEVFATPINTAYLDRLQRSAAQLALSVVETVTHMGWRFPGSNGPGEPVWQSGR